MSVIPTSYRLAVASRVVAALAGGYLLASLANVAISLLLPLARAEAVVSGMMLSFLVLLVAILWCFACRSATRAWLGLLVWGALLAALDAGLYWSRAA
jgi:hypothetical protein